MEHSVVSVVGVLISKVLIPINAAGSGRLAIPFHVSACLEWTMGLSDLTEAILQIKCPSMGLGFAAEFVAWRQNPSGYLLIPGATRLVTTALITCLPITAYIVVSVDHENKYDPVGKAPLYPTRYA